MQIWLFNPYGPLPTEPWRPYRFALLGNALAARGHQVTWWTSSFSHHFKRQRADGWLDVPVSERFRIRLVPTPSYTANIGFARAWRDAVFAWRASSRARRESPPAVIISAESPLTFGWAGPRVARMFGIPYLCDVFDLWPELFRVFLPRWMQKFDRQIFWPLYLSRRLTWRRASGIVALCDSYLDVVHAESSGLSLDEGLVIYNGTDVARLRELLPNRSPRETSPFEEGTLNAVFAGTLGDNYDVRTILRAASAFQLLPSGRRLRFVVAGDGPLRRLVEEAAARGELDYLGVLGPKALAEAHSRSDVGLVSYQKDSNVGIPDKFYDYLAAGLPVVNSLRGDVASLVAGWDIGAAYIAGDPASLVRAIDHVVKDQPSYAASAARAWDKATMFEQKGQYDRYAEFVERIAENAGADRPPVSG